MTPICFVRAEIMKTLFKNANDELEKISQWFKANIFSSNEEKTKSHLCHKRLDKGNLPFSLPNLKTNTYEIKRSSLIKFHGVLLDENVTWVDHIAISENKLFKNLKYYVKQKNKQPMINLY